jgi:glycosyltransferase involved in cell wall biosynthesis
MYIAQVLVEISCASKLFQIMQNEAADTKANTAGYLMTAKYAASIIIPTYNRSSLVSRAIETAIEQTVACEVIVCDHGSLDETQEVVTAYKDKLQYVRRESDSGPFFSWLDGIQRATAEYVHITPDDDWIDVNFIERCLSVFTSDCAFSFSSALVHGDAEPPVSCFFNGSFETGIHETREIEALLLGPIHIISPGCAIFRKDEAVKAIMTAGVPLAAHHYHGVGPDLMLFLLPLLYYRRFGYVNEPLAHFRAHDGSITVGALRDEGKWSQMIKAYDEARKVYLILKSAQEKNLGTKLLGRWRLRAALMRRLNSLRNRFM